MEYNRNVGVEKLKWNRRISGAFATHSECPTLRRPDMKLSKNKKIFLACAISVGILAILSYSIYDPTFSVTGSPLTEKVTYKTEMPWNYKLICNYKNFNYAVTRTVIPAKLINSKLTTIGYNGPEGGIYSVYSIKHVKDYKQIAIKTEYGYLLADKAV